MIVCPTTLYRYIDDSIMTIIVILIIITMILMIMIIIFNTYMDIYSGYSQQMSSRHLIDIFKTSSKCLI